MRQASLEALSLSSRKSGENLIVVDSGANHADPTIATRAAEVMGARDLVVLQGELSELCTQSVIESTKTLGARVLLNLAPVQSVAAASLGAVDPLVVNEGEARGLATKFGCANSDSIEVVLQYLLGFCPAVVITRGGDGVIVGDSSGIVQIAAEQVSVADTTGAGDAFVGGLAVALLEGVLLRHAARFANHVAAHAVSHVGAMDAYPMRRDLTISS